MLWKSKILHDYVYYRSHQSSICLLYRGFYYSNNETYLKQVSSLFPKIGSLLNTLKVLSLPIMDDSVAPDDQQAIKVYTSDEHSGAPYGMFLTKYIISRSILIEPPNDQILANTSFKCNILVFGQFTNEGNYMDGIVLGSQLCQVFNITSHLVPLSLMKYPVSWKDRVFEIEDSSRPDMVY